VEIDYSEFSQQGGVVRRNRTDEFNVEVAEECLFMIGDARDWVDNAEVRFIDLIYALEEGKTTSDAARLTVRQDFQAVRKDLRDWESRFAGSAQKAEFPYLHPSLRIARVLAPLPELGT
jgi:hypothetical protein